ncbi:MAG: hypothetical protein HY904_22000 [Deltaproteobacteria bacterium]|nr:hypothetical protein [Deltaproteobacteria bacterium]
MFSRSTMSAMVGGVALGAGIAAAVLAQAQEDPNVTRVMVAQPAPTPGMRALPPDQQHLHVQALAADTFITVKDHGDSQTVSVFKLDPKGINHMTHKAKFFF